MNTRTAACCCGQLRVICAGQPVRVSMCHCLECQRRTGSVFGVQARFADADVTVVGSSTAFTRRGDDGGSATFRFCPDCGSTVLYTLAEDPGLTAVAVGAFAEPTFPAPTRSVYEERRHAWTRGTDPAGMEHWD